MAPRGNTSSKNIVELLLSGNNLVKVFGFLSSITVFSFGIGFYFGNQSEQAKHSIEISNLNFQHNKDLIDAYEKKIALQDNIIQQKIEQLEKKISDLQSQTNGKH